MQEGTYCSVAEETLPSQTEICYMEVAILWHCTNALLETDCLTVAGFIAFTEHCVVETEVTLDVLHIDQHHCNIFIEVKIWFTIIHCCIRYVVQFVIETDLSIFAIVAKWTIMKLPEWGCWQLHVCPVQNLLT